MGAKIAMIRTDHRIVLITSDDVGPPSVRARNVSIVTETGWFLAHGCSHPGMLSTGTNAADANTSGASTGNAAACAVSGSFTANPTVAKIHDIAHPNNRINEIPGSSASTVVWIRHPTTNPTTIMRSTTKTFRIRSATVRPTRTAGVHIGSAWNRSIRPLFRSV